MNYGEKIAALRKEKGMTQAELGSALNVTFQAVSKWERGDSSPDFATMSRIAKLFGVPISYFEDDDTHAGEKDDTLSPISEQAGDDIAPHNDAPKPMRKDLGFCTKCGNLVFEGSEAERSPLVCRECADKTVASGGKRSRGRAMSTAGMALRNRGLIASALICGAIIVILLISFFSAGIKTENGIRTVDYSCIWSIPIVIVFGFPFVAQLFWDGIVLEIVLLGGKWIGMPGVIFTLDMDGIIFLIAVKILFAVIKMIIFLLTLLFFAAVAALISPFTFFPQMSKL